MKKVVSLLTAIMLLLSVTVNGVVFAQADPELVVSNVTGYIGDQVEIKVQLKNSPGFGGMAYDVKYDNTKLKLISYETDLGKSICTDSGKDRYPDKMNFQYAGTSNIEGDGVLVSFIFEILDVAPGATNITVIPQIGTTFYYVGHTETDFTLDNASGSVTIKTRPVPVTGIALDRETASIGTGETLTLTPIFSPETATNKNVTWSSSDRTVATVENSIVTPLKKGTTTITVTTEDGGFSASCLVTVNCSHLNTTDVPAEDSTCIKHGHKAYTVCNDCSEITRGSNSELPLGDHIGGTATCVKKAVCNVCHKEHGNLAAHKYGGTVKADYLKTAATCGSKAVYYKSCFVCGIQSEETFETGDYDYTNHIGETYLKNQKEATCKNEGYTGDTYCRTCDREISKGRPIAKNAHNPASVWTTDETSHWKKCQTVGCGNIIDKAAHSGGEATCVNKAICSVCKVEYGAIDPSNHKHTEVRDAKDATCCEKGYTGDTYCTDCNALISSGAEIPATGNHTDADGKWETDDTNHWHTCYFGTKFDITAHNGGEATCKNQAECSECGHSYGPLDASNHKGTTYLKNQKEATCYEEGYTGDICCSDCNEKIADGKSIAKNAHNPASVWTTDEHDHWKECQTVGCGNVIDKAAHSGGEATCISKAVCEVCKAQYGDIDAANHKHTEIRDAKPATEQEKGYTGNTWCIDCNTKIATGSEIAMLEHKPKLVEAKDATVTEQGNIKYYYCENCGKYFADEDGTKEISLSETVIKKLPPEIIEGNNAIVNNGEKKSLTFRSNAAFTDFIRVELDGKILDEKDYTKAEGSIIVTLNNDFVSTLSVGEHTLGIVSESGTATAKFTVKANGGSAESPKTGDNNNIVVWSLIAVLSLAGLSATVFVSKKKRVR
mgnify:CR=1 FL=1